MAGKHMTCVGRQTDPTASAFTGAVQSAAEHFCRTKELHLKGMFHILIDFTLHYVKKTVVLVQYKTTSYKILQYHLVAAFLIALLA